MAAPQLNELMYGQFYDLFKRLGFSISPDQLEHIRTITDRMVAGIQNEIKEGMRKIAVGTIEEMKALEERLNGQKIHTETASSEGSDNTTVS